MVIAPHPDDAELGMGGTIAALEAAGIPVAIVDLTDGEPTPCGTLEERMRERDRATQILKLSERRLLDIKNREVFDTVENRKKLATVMRELKPEILFAPFWEDGHPDHWNATQLADSARFYSKFVKTDMAFEPYHPRRIFYYVNSHIRPKLQPSFIFDISSTIEQKMGCIEAYGTQFVTNPRNLWVLDMVRDSSRYWGHQIGVQYGEPFIAKEHLKVPDGAALLGL